MIKKVFVEYEESSTGGEPDDPGDRWSSRSDTVTEFRVVGVTTKKPDTPYYSIIDTDLPDDIKEVYVIHVRYSTGDTFGRETGCGVITDVVATKEAAKTVIESIKSKDHPMTYRWSGYFDRFESCHAEPFTLNDSKNSALHFYGDD